MKIVVLALIVVALMISVIICKKPKGDGKKNKNNKSNQKESSDATLDLTSSSGSSYDDETKPNKQKSPIIDLNGDLRRNFGFNVALNDVSRPIVCSPITAIVPLAKMIYGGTSHTETEILRTIGIKSIEKVLKNYKTLGDKLKKLPGAHLDIASQLFIPYIPNKHIVKTFSKQVSLVFNSLPEVINYKDSSVAAAYINDWVAQKTFKKISKIIQATEIGERDSVVAINAIHFYGYWKYLMTKVGKHPFTGLKSVRDISMMNSVQQFKHARSWELNSDIIEIPYKTGKVSMFIILPELPSHLFAILEQLKSNPEYINQIPLKKKLVNVTIPRFKIETRLDLKKEYKKLGMHEVIDGVGLPNIYPDTTLFLTTAIQYAVLDVTSERGNRESAPRQSKKVKNKPITFFANRTFLFVVVAIKEQLFVGTMS